MPEIVVVGSFKARPWKEAEAQEAFEALVPPTHDEEGCILYALNRGFEDPARLIFIERWATPEAHDAHMESGHIKEFLTRVDDLFGDNADIARYVEVPAGEEKKGSLSAHAGD
jgi:quinol monooxygenase YgiN